MSHSKIKSELAKQQSLIDNASSDMLPSIDYQGLAQESAAVAAAAASSRQKQKTPQEHHQQMLEIQQQNQQYSHQNESEPNTPTTEVESPNDIEDEGGEQDSNHVDNIKNPHRIKLSAQDVKLILYLIVETKPFKYVGDRSLSQTKKWEIIQKKYFNLKFKELQHKNFVVPTVRTLQRQLAAGVKKASSQRSKDDIPHPIPPTLEEIDNDNYYNFATIDESSPQEELESALLDLHHLSNKIKSLKMQSNSLIKVNYQPRIKSQKSSTTIDSNGKETTKTTESKDLSSHIEEISNLLLEKFTNLKKDVQQENANKYEETFNVLELVFQHSNELRNFINEENLTLTNTINSLVETHLNKIEFIKKEYNLKQLDLIKKFADIYQEDLYNNDEDSHQLLLEKINSIKEIVDV
ncbi:hypothetical protein KGF54_000938 [Candida jiufengensis]|uniref:uncharacterized protein n=1 Tax=Candida jiufengensis TaxID=497108 RepID=UPI002224B8FC|nr:uncharacterized protein KGF54_000938 [Candida jiufengensis]KAI5956463.1 hypothetical protein KGF54_000938 [Candida jiufengensis]